MVVAALFCGWLPISATVVGTGLVLQPTYLGNASQPDRIPLSPVIYNANHGYGSHSAIFQSRPCFHGHFLTNTRPEYEQNLAVLYGISCELSDPTQMQGCTATFTLGKAQVPMNAPYTQEQVLAASLQTLFLHTGDVSQKYPLTIEIKAEGIPQPDWAAKYARPYFYPDEDLEKSKKGELKLKPLAVPGITIDDTTLLGVTYLVIDGIQPDPKITPQKPVFVPFMLEGEGDYGSLSLVPLWPGNSWSEPIGVLTRPDLPYYEKWSSGRDTLRESDAMPHQSFPPPLMGFGRLSIVEEDSLYSVRVEGGEMNPQQFAAFVYSCVATVRPTEQRPLEIVFSYFKLHDEYQALLNNDPAWKDGTSCRFVVDTKTMKLLKGSVPGYEMKFEWGYMRMVRKNDKETMFYEEDPAPPWISEYLKKISKDLPAVAEKDHKAVIQSSKVKLTKWVADGKGELDDILLIMLTLHRYENDVSFFENLWWRDKHRVTRAVAAYFAEQGFMHEGVTIRPQLEKHMDQMQYNSWEHQMRSQEISYQIQSRIGKAIQAWEKRCDALNAPEDPVPIEQEE